MNKILLLGLGCLLAGTSANALPTKEDVISIRPEGKLVTYAREASGYTKDINEYSETMPYSIRNSVSQIVFGENNEVYIKNIVTRVLHNTWVKGVQEGDKITFTMPQALYQYNGYGDLEAPRLEVADRLVWVGNEDNPWFEPDTQNHTITYTVNPDDGTITLDEGNIVGLMNQDDEEWLLYADMSQKFIPTAYEAATPPTDLTIEEWTMTVNDQYRKVNIGVSDNEVWIQGLLQESFPNAWIKGTREGSKVSFAGNQYLGIQNNYMGDLYRFLIIGKTVDGKPVISSEPAFYEYDEEEGTLTPAEDVIFIVSSALDELLYPVLYQAPDFKIATTGKITPPDPEPYRWVVYSSEVAVDFRMPFNSVDGDYLEPDKYFFRIWVNKQPFTFEPDEYPVDKPMTLVPSNLDFEEGIMCYKYFHTVAFYMEGIENVAIQSLYITDDYTTESQIILFDTATQTSSVWDPKEDGVSGIDAGKEVATTAYFDLTGRRIEEPASGLVIRRKVFTDGSVKVEKIRIAD